MMKFLEELTDLVFIEDLPQKSDIIFIPGGRYGALALQAARLYKEGLAPLILPSGKYSKLSGYFEGPADMPDPALKNCPTEWAFMDHILRSQGVPADAILKEDQATFTYENAIFSRQTTDRLGLHIRRAIICCQAYHAKRCRIYYEILYPDTQFFICPVSTQDISRNNWYRDERKIDTVLGEISRLGDQFHQIVRQYGMSQQKKSQEER